MESASKRKAATGAPVESEGRPSKRQKLPDDGTGETVETTRTQGLKFVECMKQAKDKTGRPIALHFLTLPDKNALPEYYQVTKLPIAIDTIENKLHNGEYTNLAQVEGDQKRLVNNAKAYNDKKSIIYEDAERLRKTASNWMVKHNPAYHNKHYKAEPTPIPGEETPMKSTPAPRVQPPATPRQPPPTPEVSTERPRRAAATAAVAAVQSMTPAPSKLRQSASAAPEGVDDNPDFAGKTFQQAQDQIIRELIEYIDPVSGLQIFLPFVQLPSRALKDYYQLIKEPMSLNGVQKKVRGVIGRGPPTGITEIKSWDAFAQMTSLIWKNARDYNEDGSDLYNVSIELEKMFTKRLAEAKSKVAEPPQPKLKLNMSTAAPSPTPSALPKQQLKIKLRQSPVSDPNTPQVRNSATPGFIVDNEALLRQQKHVMESMNGSRAARPTSSGKPSTPVPSNPFAGPRGVASTITPLPVMPARTAASPPSTNGIKLDVKSPALNAVRPASNASDQSQRMNIPAQMPHSVMAPPQARPTSGSPRPNGLMSQHTSSYNNQHHPPPNYYVPPVVPHFENFRKVPLKSVDEALIPKITLNTHPMLNLPKPWSVKVPANKAKTSHSVTMSLNQNYSYLQLTPYIPLALTNRQYRLFVSVNGVKTLEVNRLPVTTGINGAAPPSGFEAGKKKGEPVFEAKLLQGVNKVEVEIVAEKERRGAAKGVAVGESKDPKELVEVEKCTIFLHLGRF